MTEEIRQETGAQPVEDRQALYVNRFAATEKLMREFYYKQMFGGSARMIWFGVIVILWAVLTVFSVRRGMNAGDKRYFALIWAMIAALLILRLLMPLYYARLAMRRQSEAAQQGYEVETRLYKDGISLKNTVNGGTLDYEYDKVKTCLETKHLYLLMTQAKVVILLAKGGFTQGDEQMFKSFVGSKCPSARLRW